MGDRRRGDPQIRASIAREAARIMYREGVRQYFDAKRMAAHRVLGRDARGAKYRATDLPSNGEIRDALLELASLAEGAELRLRRLFALRVTALHVLRALAPWHPRLIGSVWSGYARRGSDVDVHVFADDVAEVAADVELRGWSFTREAVSIRVGNDFRTYHHLHVQDPWPYPVELSVYPVAERRTSTKSSVTGHPIDRVGLQRLVERIATDHPALWSERDWAAAGQDALCTLALEAEGDADPGDFDGLLEEIAGDD